MRKITSRSTENVYIASFAWSKHT